MNSPFWRKYSLFLAIGGLALILASLTGILILQNGSAASANVGSDSTIAVPPTTVSPTATLSPTTNTSSTTEHTVSEAVAKLPLNKEVAIADNIFVAEVTKIGDLVWNTPDGQEPSKALDPQHPEKPIPQQYAQVELSLSKVYKGSLKADRQITLLHGGPPGAKFNQPSDNFPKVGEKRVWFTANLEDYRHGFGSQPLTSMPILQAYKLKPDGSGLAPNGNTLTLSQLEDVLKNPAPSGVANRPAGPTPTPLVNAGQAVNLVQTFQLDKTQYVFIKGNDKGKSIRDNQQLQKILAVLNQPLTALSNPLQAQNVQAEDIATITFVLSNGQEVGLEYNHKDNNLTFISTTNPLRVSAPPALTQILELK